MEQLIRYISCPIQTTDGERFTATVRGAQREDGKWEGRLQFRPTHERGPTLATDRETVQTNHTQLAYWARGLEPAYLEGAFQRARSQADRRAQGRLALP